jgi:redox-sensing transcriptional repressor
MSRRPATAGRPVAANGGTARAVSRGAAAQPAKSEGAGRQTADRLGRAGANGHGIPDATVARLPVYLRALYALADRGVATVASDELAAAAGVNSAKLRKDLSHLGSYGTRGVGYDVDYLVYQVSRELGLTQDWPVLIVGAGNLGRALANYGGFASRGFHVAALVDSDPAVVGTMIARHTVRSSADIEAVIERFDVAIGVIATPAAVAQNVCDRLVAAGVTSILNFAPVVLNVPSGVDVRKVDLSIELQILAFHAQRRGGPVVRPGDRSLDRRIAGRRIDGAPRRAGAARTAEARGTSSVPGGDLSAGRDGVPGEDLGLNIAAELSVRGRTRGVPSEQPRGDNRGAVAAEPKYGAASYDPADDDDFQAGAQAVGT